MTHLLTPIYNSKASEGEVKRTFHGGGALGHSQQTRDDPPGIHSGFRYPASAALPDGPAATMSNNFFPQCLLHQKKNRHESFLKFNKGTLLETHISTQSSGFRPFLLVFTLEFNQSKLSTAAAAITKHLICCMFIWKRRQLRTNFPHSEKRTLL